MKKSFLLLMLALPVFIFAQNSYRYTISLNDTTADKHLHVSLVPPNPISVETDKPIVQFSLPKIVPGTYSISDFGRFVENFSAYDSKGEKITVNSTGVNTWSISAAKGISKIEYDLKDTYSQSTGKTFFGQGDGPQEIFNPAGTSFEKDSVYVLNLFGILGYYKGALELPIELNITHAADFYGSTSLIDKDASATQDRFLIPNYNDAVENPILYSRPDTVTVKVGTSEILISVYPKQEGRAALIASKFDSLLQAQGKYLGGKLPVEKYSFLIYLAPYKPGAYGALEHTYSSFYYMPDVPSEALIPQLYDVAAHEFFHIVTPLTIHSEEIQYFDYDNPKMSEHLWLYEGTTEYHAHSVQVKYGFISPKEFLDVIKQKMTEAEFAYNDTLSFTRMSKYVLDTFEKEYPNVYAKGALISLCLDLKLLHDSEGNFGLVDLIKSLSKKYGKDKAFKDEELFGVITELTNPGVSEFLNRYVSGTERLPFKEYLNFAGIVYVHDSTTNDFSLGKIGIGFNPETGHLVVSSTKDVNEFGRKMGYQDGDEILSINKTVLTAQNAQAFLANWKATVKEGDKLTVQVLRANEKGKAKKVKLSAPVIKATTTLRNLLKYDENPTEAQQKIRKALLEAKQ